MPSEIPSLKRNRSWIITGLLLVVLMGGLSFCSRWFETSQSIYGGDVLLIVSLLVISGGIYLFQMRLLKRTHGGKALLIWVLIVGAAMRVLVLPSVPILEVDMYRYMWDGAVTAKGISPYVYSPRYISSLTEAGHTPVEKALKGLVGESEGAFARINHGEYTTVYPPLAEAFFAAAYWVKPFSLLGLRVVFLVFDLLTLGVLALLLRRVGAPLTSIAVYWWNPLLVKEIVNSVHMDVLAFPFVLMGIFFLSRSRLFLSALSIVLAGALKLWPLVLLPLILSQALFRPRRLALLVTMILALCVLIFFPFLMSALAGDSGLLAYAQKMAEQRRFFQCFTVCFRIFFRIDLRASRLRSARRQDHDLCAYWHRNILCQQPRGPLGSRGQESERDCEQGAHNNRRDFFIKPRAIPLVFHLAHPTLGP